MTVPSLHERTSVSPVGYSPGPVLRHTQPSQVTSRLTWREGPARRDEAGTTSTISSTSCTCISASRDKGREEAMEVDVLDGSIE